MVARGVCVLFCWVSVAALFGGASGIAACAGGACNATASTTPPATLCANPLLIPVPLYGPNNQILAIMNAAMLAKLLGRDLYLSSINRHYKDPKRKASPTEPFWRYYSLRQHSRHRWPNVISDLSQSYGLVRDNRKSKIHLGTARVLQANLLLASEDAIDPISNYTSSKFFQHVKGYVLDFFRHKNIDLNITGVQNLVLHHYKEGKGRHVKSGNVLYAEMLLQSVASLPTEVSTCDDKEPLVIPMLNLVDASNMIERDSLSGRVGAALDFNAAVYEEADAILQSFRGKDRKTDCTVAVHLRPYPDTCIRVWGSQNISKEEIKLSCHGSTDAAKEIEATWEAAKHCDQQHPEQVPVFIAHPPGILDDVFQAFAARNLQIYRAMDIRWNRTEIDVFETSMIEQAVCVRSNYFVRSNSISSWSTVVEIFRNGNGPKRPNLPTHSFSPNVSTPHNQPQLVQISLLDNTFTTPDHAIETIDAERKPATILPKFKTSSELIGAIDLCLQEPPGRCHILHLTPLGVYLDAGTPTLTPRIQYIVAHLRNLKIPREEATFVFYTADTIPVEFRGLPIISHTTDNHTSHLLFPTPYLLRDLEEGHLEEVLRFCNESESLLKRRNTLYFRGRWRDLYRVKFAQYAQQFHSENLTMDIGLVDLPTGGHNLSTVQHVGWTEKSKYQYLLTLKGGWSSQWEVYHDYIAGGLIVRDIADKCEYWNYDIVSESTVNFQTIEKTAEAILDPIIQTKKEAMANRTKAWACFHLQPQNILGYSQAFVNEYSRIFEGMVQNRTYSFQRNRTWAPQKIQILF